MLACGADKAKEEFSKSQRKGAAANRKCSSCATDASAGAGNAVSPPPIRLASVDASTPREGSAPEPAPADLVAAGAATAEPDPEAPDRRLPHR